MQEGTESPTGPDLHIGGMKVRSKEAPVRVAIIVTQLEAGGAQTAALRLAEGLRSLGYDAQTWFLYKKQHTEYPDTKVDVIAPERPNSLRKYVGLLADLLRRLRQHRPQAVISFTHYANVISQPVALLSGVPLRIASQRNPATNYPRLARLLDRIWGATGVYSANVAVSRAVSKSFDAYSRFYRKRLRIVPNGVEPWQCELTKEEARLRLQLPLGVPLLANVGRIAPQKNQATLIRALALCPNVHIAIAGAGELLPELKSIADSLKVSQRVHWLGQISPDRVRMLLQASDAFLLPSLFEGMSNALLEALAAGTPVIVSDIPSQREVVGAQGDEKPAGVLLPPQSVHEWASAFRRISKDKVWRYDLANRSQMRASRFSVETMINGFSDIINNYEHRHLARH